MSCTNENDEAARYAQWMILHVGQSLRRCRCAQGLTVREVADRCGLERPNLSRIEFGKANITLRTLCRICIGLGTDIRTLFSKYGRMLIISDHKVKSSDSDKISG